MSRTFNSLVVAIVLGACVTEEQVDEDATACTDGKCDSPDSADNPRVPHGSPTRYPIVLVHGFAASPQRNGFNAATAQSLCDDGHSVFLPSLSAFAGNLRRAQELATEIDGILAGKADFCGRTPSVKPTKVNIIAHSMGGTDARVLVQGTIELQQYEKKVASITTISSPHTGSAMADLVLRVGAWQDRLLGDKGGTALEYLGRFSGVVIPSSPAELPTDMHDAFFSISTANDTALWVPYGVKVFSWAGLSNVLGTPNPRDEEACEYKMSLFPKVLGVYQRHWMSALLAPIAWVVADEANLVPNDGLVQVERAKWGEFRGCIPADHAAEVGAFPLSGFDHVRFLRNRAFELSARGL